MVPVNSAVCVNAVIGGSVDSHTPLTEPALSLRAGPEDFFVGQTRPAVMEAANGCAYLELQLTDKIHFRPAQILMRLVRKHGVVASLVFNQHGRDVKIFIGGSLITLVAAAIKQNTAVRFEVTGPNASHFIEDVTNYNQRNWAPREGEVFT